MRNFESMERFKKQITLYLSQATETQIEPQEIETPPDRNLGDFAYPCFRIAKTQKKSPVQISSELTSKIASFLIDQTIQVKAVGPYVNFTVQTTTLIQTILKDILINPSPYGTLPSNSREKWVFEFSSPNVAKPFQIYHLRTTIVGSSLSKIAKYRGYQVTTINHLGDWGTQYGKLAIALKKYAKNLPEVLKLKDLVAVYVQIHKDIENDPSIEKAGQEAFLKLEQGDPEMRAIWKKCVDISIDEFKETYKRYQVDFDHYWGESHYEEQLKPLLNELRNKKLLIQDQGAWVVKVNSRDGQELPPCILEKSDGASIYATRDLAAAIYRYQNLKFDRMSYVVGKEQKFHFEQLFGVLRAMELPWEKDCEHIATGLYRFKDSKMSTRKGNFITLEEVNELCFQKALTLLKERAAPKQEINTTENQTDTHTQNHPILDENEINIIADQVTLGAIVFADLSIDPSKDMEFDSERVISFEGETGPYLQYAHTRCMSILRKATEAGFSQNENLNFEVLANQYLQISETYLIKSLGRFPSALERTLEQRKPSQLCTYLIELTRDFSAFYRECKVMNSENKPQTEARLALVLATQKVLSSGLDLLGIPKPEKM